MQKYQQEADKKDGELEQKFDDVNERIHSIESKEYRDVDAIHLILNQQERLNEKFVSLDQLVKLKKDVNLRAPISAIDALKQDIIPRTEKNLKLITSFTNDNEQMK